MIDLEDYLEQNGVSLVDLEVAGFALPLEKVESFLRLAQRSMFIILGGDLYILDGKNNALCSSYENWYCEPQTGEGRAEYVARSVEAVRAFIVDNSLSKRSGVHLNFVLEGAWSAREGGYEKAPDTANLFKSQVCFQFTSPDGKYDLTIDPAGPDQILVRCKGAEEVWSIDWKGWFGAGTTQIAVGGSVKRTSSVISEWAWFQLYIGDDVRIEYWGDKVIIREDKANKTSA